MKTCLLVFIAAFGLFPIGARAQAPIRVEGQKPSLNVESIATAGDPVWETFNYRIDRVRYLIPEAEMTQSWPGWKSTIPAGAKLLPMSHNKAIKACSAIGTAKNTFGGDDAYSCAYDDNRDGMFDRIGAVGGMASKVNPTKYQETVADRIIDGDGFRSIVYLTGIANNTLRLSYREFKNDFARPAFTQDLEFGLNDILPQEVNFKNVRMRILQADGNGLKYVIIGNNNP